MTGIIEREELIRKFAHQLSKIGFKEVNSGDSRVKTFMLTGGTLVGRENYRSEVNLDFYGFKIVYYPKQYKHYVRSVSWSGVGDDSAKATIEKFLKAYYL